MQTDIQPTSKFESIVKKAKEKRSCKEKLLNSSHDRSFKALQQRKKRNMLQSFVMRQTVALSAKNKQLTSALIQSRQTVSEFEANLQKMQERMMMLIMKLNSKEVALKKCTQELDLKKKALQCKEETYEHFYTRLHDLAGSIPKPNETSFKDISPARPRELNNQPKRVPILKASSSRSSAQINKWKPDLSIVQEKLSDDSSFESSRSIVRSSLINNNEEETNKADDIAELSSHTFKTNEDSSLLLSPCLSDDLRPDSDYVSEKDRRGSSLFSLSSFDPDQANFNISTSDQLTETARTAEINESLINARSISDDDFEASEKETLVSTLKSSKKASKTKKKNFLNTSYEENTVIYLDQSMNLTNPVESEIIVTKAKKPNNGSKKEAKSKRSKKTKRVEKADKAKWKKNDQLDKDVYNCSSDSFLLNPDKKIELSKERKSQSKSKSLPMSNITNEMDDEASGGRRCRRRTAGCVSYKEPSLAKKMRQGDIFFPSAQPS